MENDNNDYLSFKNDKEIENIISGENLIFSDKIIKINRYGINQERFILITDKAIYNLKKKSKHYCNKNNMIYYSFKKKNSFKYYFRNNS